MAIVCHKRAVLQEVESGRDPHMDLRLGPIYWPDEQLMTIGTVADNRYSG